MKNRTILILVTAVTLGGLAMADIQSPPGARWNWSRKLSRAVANIIYGVTEIPITAMKVDRTDGSSAAFTSMGVDGTKRTVVRFGYGLYELVTFPFPSYKGGYRPPYYKHDKFDPWRGYQEFPPQLGISTQANYCRGQSW